MSRVFNRNVIFDGALKVTAATATATTGAATLNRKAGTVTSESLTTAQNAIYSLVLTNDKISTDSVVVANVSNGTNTQGTPMIGSVTVANGSVTIQVINKHATAVAFNGTVKVSFVVIDQKF